MCVFTPMWSPRRFWCKWRRASIFRVTTVTFGPLSKRRKPLTSSATLKGLIDHWRQGKWMTKELVSWSRESCSWSKTPHFVSNMVANRTSSLLFIDNVTADGSHRMYSEVANCIFQWLIQSPDLNPLEQLFIYWIQNWWQKNQKQTASKGGCSESLKKHLCEGNSKIGDIHIHVLQTSDNKHACKVCLNLINMFFVPLELKRKPSTSIVSSVSKNEKKIR